jgi:hypothetical protein
LCCLIAKASLVVAGGTGKGLWGRPFAPGQPYLAQKMGRTTDDPNRFIWKATAEDIITKVKRGRETLNQINTQTDH